MHTNLALILQMWLLFKNTNILSFNIWKEGSFFVLKIVPYNKRQSRKQKKREEEIEEKDFKINNENQKEWKKRWREVDNENEKEEKEMNELTLSQQKVLWSSYMIRDDINDDDNDMDPLLQITNVSIDDDPLL